MQDNGSLARGRQARADMRDRSFRDESELDDEDGFGGAPAPISNLDLILGQAGTARGRVQPVEVPAEVEEVVAAPAAGVRKKLKFRHAALILSFIGCVAVPSTAATLYMAFIATDQYHSTASFSVRSISGNSSAGDIMGIFTQASGSSSTSDSFILMDYIKSVDMLTQIEQNFDLEKMFERRGMDYYYGLASGMPIEKRLAYWRDLVDVSFDNASSIITIELRAFDPQDAQKLTSFIISRGEQLINDLSNRARDEVLRGSRQEVARAEIRLMSAREELRRYRDEEQEIDPTQGARVASDLIAGLEGKLTELNTSLITARQQMSDDAPRIKVLVAQISSLENQIQVERQRLGSGGVQSGPAESGASGKTSRVADVADRIQRYEVLRTQEEFAQKAYAASMAGLEKARIEAESKQRYLAAFIRPSISEEAQYPKRLLDSFLINLAFLFAWASAAMIYYNVRDRA